MIIPNASHATTTTYTTAHLVYLVQQVAVHAKEEFAKVLVLQTAQAVQQIHKHAVHA